MFSPRIALTGLALLLAACAPATGDPLLDYVAAEVDPFSDCLRIGRTEIEQSGPLDVPATAVPQVFAAPQVRSAAEHLAGRADRELGRGYRYLGHCGLPGEAPRNTTFIGTPQVSGEYAFVEYSAASGEIGVFAFRRVAGAWIEAEHVRLGWW
jgi:hypothetical protein